MSNIAHGDDPNQCDSELTPGTIALLVVLAVAVLTWILAAL